MARLPAPSIRQSAIAPLYDPTETYAVGDVRTQDGFVWECSTAITMAEAWNASHWTKRAAVDLIMSTFNALIATASEERAIIDEYAG